MKTIKTNQFSYKTNTDSIISGYFDIYQSRSGAIRIVLGNSHATLSLRQIKKLNIDIFELCDFDHDLYKKCYFEPDDPMDDIDYFMNAIANRFWCFL